MLQFELSLDTMCSIMLQIAFSGKAVHKVVLGYYQQVGKQNQVIFFFSNRFGNQWTISIVGQSEYVHYIKVSENPEENKH